MNRAIWIALTVVGTACTSGSGDVGVSAQALAQVETRQIRGQGAYGFTSASSEDGCEYRFLTVAVSEQMDHAQGQPVAGGGGFLSYGLYNYCTFQFAYSDNFLDGVELTGRRLDEATVALDLPIRLGHYDCAPEGCGWVDDGPMRLQGTVTWTGFGDTFRGSSQSTTSSSIGNTHTSTRQRYTGASREATMSVNLALDGAPLSFSPEASNGTLWDASSGTITRTQY